MNEHELASHLCLCNDLELVDKWIDAIPDDPYAPCPCGCGKKFKFVKDELEKHEKRFYENEKCKILKVPLTAQEITALFKNAREGINE